MENVHPQSAKTRTALGRKLGRLDGSDAIGILDILSNTLEALETTEAAENAHQLRHEGNEDDVFGYEDPGQVPDFSGLATATEVRKTLSAARSGRPSGHPTIRIASIAVPLREIESNNQSENGPHSLKEKLRLRSRKTKQREAAFNHAGGNSNSTGGMFGVRQRSPIPKSVKNYFATVGSTKEKRLIALSAWVITVVGLIVCLMFVTKDFLSSKSESMIAVHFVSTPKLDLPEVFLCKPQQAMPMFWETEEGFFGEPSFWVDSVTTPGNDSTITKTRYPETHLLGNLESVIVDQYGIECTDPGLQLANATRYFNGITQPLKCFPCVHFKRDPVTSIEEHARGKRQFLALEVANDIAVQTCRRTRYGMEGTAKHALIELILTHSDALQSRGILDFSGIKPQERDGFGNSRTLPMERWMFDPKRPSAFTHQFQYRDQIVSDVVDVLCNTYLFSGYFYPKPDSQEVSFKYNTVTQRWNRVGAGPYVPPERSMYYNEPKYDENDGTVKSGQLISFKEASRQTPATSLDDLRDFESSDVINDRALRAFIKPERNGSVLNQLSSLKRPGSLDIFLVRSVVNTIESFTSRSETIPLHYMDGTTLNYVYSVRLMMDDFLTRQVSDQATVQVTSFLADFFGLIELFLDLSVFTLIVSPVVVSSRRKALLARARALNSNKITIMPDHP